MAARLLPPCGLVLKSHLVDGLLIASTR